MIVRVDLARVHPYLAPLPNGFAGPLAGTNPTKQVKVGHPPEIWLDTAGFADVLSTNHTIRITNPSATTTATVRVFLAV